MQPLRYSIQVSLDGCCDHAAMSPDGELHQYSADTLARNDTLLFGRTAYQMMEGAWRPVARGEGAADWVQDWMVPFARTIDAAKKYVVSDTLESVDWNAQIIRGGELETRVRQLKAEEGRGIMVGGMQLPLALARLGLIDEYEFVVYPRIVGHGPTLLQGLAGHVDLRLVEQREFKAGAVAMRYVPVH